MTIEEKAKAYDKALEVAQKELKQDLHESGVWAIKRIFPQFCESEDERTRKEILNFIKSFWMDHKESIPRINSWLAWLEKQKEPENTSASTMIPSCWEIEQKSAECSEDERIRKDIISIVKEYGRICEKEGDPCCTIGDCLAYLEKQKEPHFTKRNALFDKCVKNCDPEIMKRVSDEVDEMLKKEQKHPNGCFTCDEYKKGYEEGRRNGFTAGYNKAMKEVEQKEQKPAEVDESTKRLNENWMKQHFDDYKEQKPAEWVLPEDFEEAVYKVANFISPFDSQEELRKVSHRFAEQLLSLAKKELDKPAEWSEEDKSFYDSIMCEVVKEGMHPTPAQKNWLESLPERFNLQTKQEWSEEDEQRIAETEFAVMQMNTQRNDTKNKCLDWLKSLRPQGSKDSLQTHWKPSKQEIDAFETALKGEFQNGVYPAVRLCELFQKLKKLYYNDKIPHWKPSEEEVRLINTSISFLKDFADKGYENAVECIDWLKSKLNGNSGK